MTETRGRPVTNRSHRAQARRTQYATLRSVRLCAWSVSCGQTVGMTPYCDEHRGMVNDANRRLFESRRANGLCRNCGTQVIGRSRCWLCAKKREGYASRQPEYRKAKERA